MHTIIVCGSPWCDTPKIQATLESAGLSPANVAVSGSVTTPTVWHERLLAGRMRLAPPQQQVQPGKAWELAASEIFLANWDQPLWGWADHRSTWLLDFWLHFDPQTRFLLVHTPAAQVLAKVASRASEGVFSASEVLQTWSAYQGQMLKFYHRHRDRCAWILDHAHQQPDAWLPTLPAEWGLNAPDSALALFQLEEQAEPEQAGHFALLQSLSVQAVQQSEQTQALQSELLATLPKSTEWPLQAATPAAALDAAQALEQISQLAASQRLDAELQREHAQQARAAAEALQAAQAQAHAEQSQQMVLQLQHAQARAEQLAQENAALSQANSVESKAKSEATEEAEVLLNQLNQVQGELEKTLTQSARLQQKHDMQTKAQAELEQKLQHVENARLAVETRLKAQALANADQDKYKQAHSQIEHLAKAKAALQARLDAEANARIETAEEAELLLLQLHQVQEELERYFLQYQQLQQDNARLQTRLDKWALRNPDHCEWDGLAVLPDTQASQQSVLISGLQHGSRALGKVRLGLNHTQKLHTLVLTRQADQPPPLLSWPKVSGTGGTNNPVAELALNLHAVPGTPDAIAWAQLAPSDLHLLKATCKAIAANLPANTPNHPAWVGYWQTAAAAFDLLPAAWRFDAISLRHEQVNPDYEHLWLRFANAQYGARNWPLFEFRLSASNVRKAQFSKQPKLEFPLPEHGGPKQFESWFEESEDDKGPKFELRFDIKAPAMDIGCWNSLNPQDQAQATELIEQLPRFLGLLEASGTHIHRPWADWHNLAAGMQHALATCLNLSTDTSRHEIAAATAV
ncbi:hypothetical protein LJR066_001195 [Acidovorax sp. LjRoot66]|uniref:hypothetical protein n=1 Tax=Acidovorax sp. LjRoot66 TaxID=3342334 RepID=UPI003ED0FBA2